MTATTTAATPVSDSRARRLASGLSLREVARRLGFSAQYVGDLERGRRMWNNALRVRYEAALVHDPQIERALHDAEGGL